MSALGFCGFFVTLSSLPAYTASKGASASSAGATTTVMLAATVLCQPLVPRLLRRLSTSVTMSVGLVALGLPAPALIWASTGLPLYAVCVVRGFGFAVVTVTGAIMTSEVAPVGRHGQVSGLYGLAAAVPNLVMIPLSVLVLQRVGFWPIAMIATLPVLGAALAWNGRRRETHARGHQAAPAAPDTRLAVVRTLAPATVLCALTIVGGAVVTFLPIERSTGYVASAGLLLYGFSGALARWRSGILIDRVGGTWPLLATCGVAAVGVLALGTGLTTSVDAVTLLACLLIGGAYGAVQSITLVSTFARISAADRAVASAVWNAAFDMGTAMGALVIGVLAASPLGVWGAFAVLAALVVATIPAGLASGKPLPG